MEGRKKVPRVPFSSYAELIQKATGAKEADLRALEDIMRQDIFHSTLDWQTEAQLTRAAKQAVEVLRFLRAPKLTMAEVDLHDLATGHRSYLRLAKDEHVCKDCLKAGAGAGDGEVDDDKKARG